MLNKAPNRNDATGVANNVRLTTMGAIHFSMAAVYLVIDYRGASIIYDLVII